MNRTSRIIALATAAFHGLTGCGGGPSNGASAPSPTEHRSTEGALTDIKAEVALLRAEGPTISPSAELGALPGSVSVNAMGHAQFSVPLDVAPGANGLQPALTIGYSSAANDGLLGLGFSLPMGESIARCRDSIADDGTIDDIGFDDSDALCLNGQRITLVAGSYGDEGSEYRTIRDPSTKIVLESGSIEDRASAWAVYRPNGDVLRFNDGSGHDGQTTQMQSGLAPVPQRWLLSSRNDRFGNALRYDWTIDPEEYALDRITYANGAAVELSYVDRIVDEVHGYRAGEPFARTLLLDQVTIRGGGGSLLHTYTLKYSAHPDTLQSTLTSIQKCDAAGSCLPATSFDWTPVDTSVDEGDCEPIQLVDGGDACSWPPGWDSGVPVCNELARDSSGRLARRDYCAALNDDPSSGVVLGADSIRALAPRKSVVLDAFGDLTHEVLLWDPNVSDYVTLWSRDLPGDDTPMDTWRRQYAASYPGSMPGWGELPPDGDRNDLATYRPSWNPMATRIFGRSASDVLFPRFTDEPGLGDVHPSIPGLDPWGVSFATDFIVLAGATYNAVDDHVQFQRTYYDDGPNGKIYNVVPLDHDGDGLTDIWLCRGDGFKTSRWVLGRNQGGTQPPFDFSWTQTSLQCSIHDELLTLPLHGDGRTSLLSVPAYDSNLAVSDLADYDEYLTHPDLQPLTDDARTEYLEVDPDENALVSVGLPRDYYQRWNDRNCDNSVADAQVGAPVYSAGMGPDRVVDINGDGYADVVRAELEIGDNVSNIEEIKEALNGDEFLIGSCPGQQEYQECLDACADPSAPDDCEDDCEEPDPSELCPESCGDSIAEFDHHCAPSQNQTLVLRVYENTGDGFVRRETPLLTLDGIAHANYWINWQGAQVFDGNADGLLDFLLPGRGIDEDGDGLDARALSSDPDGDYHLTGGVDLPDWYPSYQGGGEWKDLFHQGGRTFATDDGHILWFVGIGRETDYCTNGTIARRAVVAGADGAKVRLKAVTNGLGATQSLTYERADVEDRQGARPGGRIRQRPTVVSELTTQVSPTAYRTVAYVYEDPYWDDHGRGFLGFRQVTREQLNPTAIQDDYGEAFAVTVQEYDRSYDEELRDYPFVGRPSRSYTISYSEMANGQLQRMLACEDVESWDLVRPYEGATWFSYAQRVRQYKGVEIDNDRNSDTTCDDIVDPLQDATTELAMNVWGTPTLRRFTSEDEVTTTSYSQWVDDEDEWFVGRPQRTVVESCKASTCQQRVSTRTYDPATHTTVDSFREPNATDSRYQHTSFTYNAHGNLATATVEGHNEADARTTTTNWDEHGVRPLSFTNTLGQTSYTLSDEASGTLFATVDPNGTTIRHAFDGFRRTTFTSRHESPMSDNDGAPTSIFYSEGDEALGAVMQVREQTLGQSTRTEIGPTGKTLKVTFRGVPETETFPPAAQLPFGEIYVLHEYDNLGRLARTSHNTFDGQEPDHWVAFEYDELSRQRRAFTTDSAGVEVAGTSREWDYVQSADIGTGSTLPERVIISDEEGNQTSTVNDHKGRPVVTVDALGIATCLNYGVFGQVDSIQRNCLYGATGPSPTTVYQYDSIGRRISETDPAFGTKAVSYTEFDEVETALDAQGQLVAHVYDPLGRRTHTVAPEGTSTWTYDQTRIGTLSKSSSPDGIDRTFNYNALGLMGRVVTALPPLGSQPTGDVIQTGYSYGIGGRLESIGYESGISTSFHYDGVGYHRSTEFDGPDIGSQQVWGLVRADEDLAVVDELLGDGTLATDRARTLRAYDPATGRLETSTTLANNADIVSFSFGWTPAGDLDWRLDAHTGQYEEFEHDAIHRMTESSVEGITRAYEYDPLGNLTFKDGVGDYTYDASGVHLLYTSSATSSTTYKHDANGAVIGKGGTDISWTSFGKLRTISEKAEVQQTIRYDAEGTRVIREDDEGFVVYVNGVHERRYDASGNLLETRIRATDSSGAAVAEYRYDHDHDAGPSEYPWDYTSTRYIHDDHLGSAALVTDQTGAELERIGYDPWGRARDAQDWNQYLADDATDDLPIGYTGHQPYLESGLINMRGRMYDPQLGRFMSVDPVVAGVLDGQAWNNYAYVKNRPLSLVDPTGLVPEGENDSNSGWGENREWSEDFGGWCDEYSDGTCTRVISVETAAASTDIPQNGGPGGSYWGNGDGSGIGMRGWGDVMQEGLALKAKHQFQEELAFQRAMGRTCTANGVCTLPDIANLNADTKRQYEETVLSGLSLLPGIGPLADGVELANALADGDGDKAAIAAAGMAVGLIPGIKVLGKGAGLAAEAAEQAMKHGDEVADVAKGVKKIKCFVPGTSVLMANGDEKSIETIEVGDWVATVDPEHSDLQSPRQVTEVVQSFTHRIVSVWIETSADGSDVIEVTGEHPFWTTDRGWVLADDLSRGDVLQDPRGRRVRVVSVDERSEEIQTFNLSVAGVHTFFVVAGGVAVLVHNTDPLRPSSSPFLPSDPYSPENVDRRRSELRRTLGVNMDPKTPIPDQGPGRDMGGHSARGRTPHVGGERNVNPLEEHSRTTKGAGKSMPRGGKGCP